jgi:uncharacterized protein (TIGR00269 family)
MLQEIFLRQVTWGIEGQKLFMHSDRILVALSSGKDSLSLMLALSRQGYKVTGLHIDLGIPGSSAEARAVDVVATGHNWHLTEFETANYAFLMGIENHYAPCPYSPGATFSLLKGLLQRLEATMPGRKLDFYQGFLKRGKRLFAPGQSKKADMLAPCPLCGYPTSSGEECGVCRIRMALKENSA